MHSDFHIVQASILKELLFNNGTNFASLNKLGLTNDHFTFHLKKLVKDNIVEKIENKYYLSQYGKTVASKLDVDSLHMEKQGTISVAVTAKKKVKGKECILIQQRLKEPFYGYFGFINGKVRLGETPKDTAKRELQEETGLVGNPKILCVYHKMRGASKKKVKLDNFFFVYLVKNPKGKLKHTIEGKNFWLTNNEILKLKLFPGFESCLKVAIEEKYTPYFEEFIKLDKI
jgi:8-oxo-dGTP pyrophosphatase MutT (NUDIX family)